MIIDILMEQFYGYGEIERIIKLVSEELRIREYEVRIFQEKPTMYSEWDTKLSNIYYYNYNDEDLNGESLLKNNANNYKKLLEILGYPDVILAIQNPEAVLLSKLATSQLKENRPPIISWLCPLINFWKKEQYFSYADLILTSTTNEKNHLLDIGIDHVSQLNVPIDINTSVVIERSTNILRLVYIGCIDFLTKRFDIMLHGLKELNGNWYLQIFGDGEDKLKLQELIKENNLSNNIELLSFEVDPWERVSEASAFLISSDYEEIGANLLDALSRGLPVISSNCDVSREIIKDDINGMLYQMEDYKKLKQILQNILDTEGKGLPSAKECIKSVKPFDKTTVVDSLIKEINGTLK